MVPFKSVPHAVYEFFGAWFLFLWKRGMKKLNTVFKDCVKNHTSLLIICVRPSGIRSLHFQVQWVSLFYFFNFFHHCPHFSSFTAWITIVTPLACWLTHHPAAPLPVIKRGVMATTVRGWKNVLRLPGTEEVRWTLSPSLKRTLKGGGEGGLCYIIQ